MSNLEGASQNTGGGGGGGEESHQSDSEELSNINSKKSNDTKDANKGEDN